MTDTTEAAPALKRYRVTLLKTVHDRMVAEIEIQAATEDEAWAKAEAMHCDGSAEFPGGREPEWRFAYCDAAPCDDDVVDDIEEVDDDE